MNFLLIVDKTDLIKDYEPEFKLGVLKTIQNIAKVTYLRINEIEVSELLLKELIWVIINHLTHPLKVKLIFFKIN